MSNYTWYDKVNNLVKLAKAVGDLLEVEIEEPGSDGHKEARQKLKEAYEEFCQWRHDEPDIVDLINTKLSDCVNGF